MSPTEQTVPLKCKQCDHMMSEVVVCDTCHALNPGGLMSDFFTLLGLPRRYALDERQLQQKFVAINRHAHPDRHSTETPESQELSLALSAAVNNAYRTLKDAPSRGAYLLELLGGKSSATDKSVPEGFLSTVMMMQEEIVEAKAQAHNDELLRLHAALVNQQEGLMRRIAELFDQYDQSVSCEAIRTDLLNEIRQQLNAVSYVRKLLTQV